MDSQEIEREEILPDGVFTKSCDWWEKKQKNPCSSVEYIYNKRNNAFYTVIPYGDKRGQWMCIYER